ncbi:MAG TPA: hypothetical protein VEG34_16855 [Thermoanaerobaculia bacterium]|nr:hypothetical protein [Thermoanaerobaculia bacterium]
MFHNLIPRSLAAGLAVLVLSLLLTPAQAAADTDFGVRGGLYTDSSSGFVGVELLTGITDRWFFNPNAEYVFVDDGDLATINLDAHYDLPLRAAADVWLGGGLAVVFSDLDRPGRRDDDSETDIGVNLLAGIGFLRREAVRPYVQGKILIADETEAVIAVGVRFF